MENSESNTFITEPENNFDTVTQSVIVKSHDKSSKKKENQNVNDDLNLNLDNYQTIEEKYEALYKLHSDTLRKFKKSDENDKKFKKLQQENLLLKTTNQKISNKCKTLEDLSRKLNEQLKITKEMIRKEKKRTEQNNDIQQQLSDFSKLLDKTKNKNIELSNENNEMQKKFKALFDQMESKEKRFEELYKDMGNDLEVTKKKHQEMILLKTKETETYLIEKSKLLNKINEYQKIISHLQENETKLHSQLSEYSNQYSEFKNALTNSSEIINGYNKEVSQMTKKISDLEEECTLWKISYQTNQKELSELSLSLKRKEKDIFELNKKFFTMEKLCRGLQNEREKFKNKLKEKSNEINKHSKIDNNRKFIENLPNNQKVNKKMEKKIDLNIKVNSTNEINQLSEKIEESNTTLNINSDEILKNSENINIEFKNDQNIRKENEEKINEPNIQASGSMNERNQLDEKIDSTLKKDSDKIVMDTESCNTEYNIEKKMNNDTEEKISSSNNSSCFTNAITQLCEEIQCLDVTANKDLNEIFADAESCSTEYNIEKKINDTEEKINNPNNSTSCFMNTTNQLCEEIQCLELTTNKDSNEIFIDAESCSTEYIIERNMNNDIEEKMNNPNNATICFTNGFMNETNQLYEEIQCLDVTGKKNSNEIFIDAENDSTENTNEQKISNKTEEEINQIVFTTDCINKTESKESNVTAKRDSDKIFTDAKSFTECNNESEICNETEEKMNRIVCLTDNTNQSVIKDLNAIAKKELENITIDYNNDKKFNVEEKINTNIQTNCSVNEINELSEEIHDSDVNLKTEQAGVIQNAENMKSINDENKSQNCKCEKSKNKISNEKVIKQESTLKVDQKDRDSNKNNNIDNNTTINIKAQKKKKKKNIKCLPIFDSIKN